MKLNFCSFFRAFHGFTAQKESPPFGFDPPTETLFSLTITWGNIYMVYPRSNDQFHRFISLLLGYFIKRSCTKYRGGTFVICPTQSSCLHISSWILLILEESSLTG